MDREAYRAMARIERTHWWFVGRRAILSDIVKTRIDLPANPRILEAGCGTGGNLDLLSSFGQLDAFELDREAREFAQSRGSTEVVEGRLPDGLQRLSPPYDLVALFDVLEHLEDDVASLTSLANLLAKDGKVILTVPAFQSLWSAHDEAHHHFRRYSRRQLHKVADAAGLKVDYSTYFNSILFPAAAAQRTLARMSGRSGELDDMPPKGINALLTNIFRFERKILRQVPFPFGLSLCAICSAATSP